MTQNNLTCILCPASCLLELSIQNGEVVSVEGNNCKLGSDYAAKEYKNPTRTLTSTVEIVGARVKRLPVKTRGEIPKEAIIACMLEVNNIACQAPVTNGQVIVENLAGTGVSLIATRTLNQEVFTA
ncbi:MAG: DUF1667 domain-containing protein [Chitinophagales bacterium]